MDQVHKSGPWTGSMDQVHGPQGGPWTGSTGVVHGPGSMFCIRPEVRSWKDGNTGVGTNECGGNQFVPINGGEKK